MRDGKFVGGKILLDATRGNIGIAYAMLGAPYRIPVALCPHRFAASDDLAVSISAVSASDLDSSGVKSIFYA